MGSLIMHLCVANKLKEKYKFSDKFVIGELMPDLLKLAGKDKNTTHYIEPVIEESGVKNLPNVLRYEQDNRDNINDEKILGYVAHLVQDKVWFDKYIGKYAKTDANDISKVEYLEYNVIKSYKEFSEDIANDYKNINKYLVDKYNIEVDSIKKTLKGISPDNEFKKKIDQSFILSNDKENVSKNTFITKEDAETFINEAVKKSVIEIDKLLGK